MRADARKNRTAILQAAEAVFATEGVSVPIDSVAQRAGVGVGTLYRHFPTKEALFEAIVTTRLEELVSTAREFADADDPGAALFAFLRKFAWQAAAKRDLFDALATAGIDIKSSCSETVEEMKRCTDWLLQRAIAAHAIREDVSNEVMIGLIVGTCQAGSQSGSDPEALRQMVEIVCDGLRRPASSTPRDSHRGLSNQRG
jgi:AcrR family transcriptional regulator